MSSLTIPHGEVMPVSSSISRDEVREKLPREEVNERRSGEEKMKETVWEFQRK